MPITNPDYGYGLRILITDPDPLWVRTIFYATKSSITILHYDSDSLQDLPRRQEEAHGERPQ